MQNAPLQNADNSTATLRATGGVFPEEMERRIWILMFTGVMVVCLANALVSMVIPTENQQTHLRAETLREYVSVLRILGVMIFAAGLVERIVLAISRIKS